MNNNKPKVIHMWSAPRSLSTATLYSFNQRKDTVCFDEPLYASYLKLHPHLYRPYREELLEKDETDSNKVLLSLMKSYTNDKPIVFAKHMAKHSIGINKSLLYDPTLSLRHH
jgi:hypothetical protein